MSKLKDIQRLYARSSSASSTTPPQAVTPPAARQPERSITDPDSPEWLAWWNGGQGPRRPVRGSFTIGREQVPQQAAQQAHQQQPPTPVSEYGGVADAMPPDRASTAHLLRLAAYQQHAEQATRTARKAAHAAHAASGSDRGDVHFRLSL
jgi:hypothetical protein